MTLPITRSNLSTSSLPSLPSTMHTTSKPRRPSPLGSRSTSFANLVSEQEGNDLDMDGVEQQGDSSMGYDLEGREENSIPEPKPRRAIQSFPTNLNTLSRTSSKDDDEIEDSPSFQPIYATITTTPSSSSLSSSSSSKASPSQSSKPYQPYQPQPSSFPIKPPQPNFPRSTRLLPLSLSMNPRSSSPSSSSSSINLMSKVSNSKKQAGRTKIIVPTEGKGWMKRGCFELGLTQAEFARSSD